MLCCLSSVPSAVFVQAVPGDGFGEGRDCIQFLLVFLSGVVGGFAFPLPIEDRYGADVENEAEFVFGHSEFAAEFADVVSGFGRWGWYRFFGGGLLFSGRFLNGFLCGLSRAWAFEGRWGIGGFGIRGDLLSHFHAEDIGEIGGGDAASFAGFGWGEGLA